MYGDPDVFQGFNGGFGGNPGAQNPFNNNFNNSSYAQPGPSMFPTDQNQWRGGYQAPPVGFNQPFQQMTGQGQGGRVGNNFNKNQGGVQRSNNAGSSGSVQGSKQTGKEKGLRRCLTRWSLQCQKEQSVSDVMSQGTGSKSVKQNCTASTVGRIMHISQKNVACSTSLSRC